MYIRLFLYLAIYTKYIDNNSMYSEILAVHTGCTSKPNFNLTLSLVSSELEPVLEVPLALRSKVECPFSIHLFPSAGPHGALVNVFQGLGKLVFIEELQQRFSALQLFNSSQNYNGSSLNSNSQYLLIVNTGCKLNLKSHWSSKSLHSK